jgi:hypothetical protein
MYEHKPRREAGWQRVARWSAFSTMAGLAATVAVAPGCLNRPIERVEPRTTTTIVERLIQSAVDKIDLVLALDNSRSMADKQTILAAAVPDLVNALVNPKCLMPDGTLAPTQPTDPLAACADTGAEREFKPVIDIHIGVVSSSIGDHGGDVCPETQPGSTNNDLGRLLTRDVSGGTVPTYNNNLGFLAWDPSQKLVPPGEAVQADLIADIGLLVAGAGEVGCGLEAQLEGWYRFLVDPNPYLTIEESGGKAVPAGTDVDLLNQRKAFMRPDSLLAVIMLTDENDCSIRDGGQYFYAAKQSSGTGQYHLPKAQIACATNPNDPCCRSCGQSADGCAPKGAECTGAYDAVGDPLNLRCFDQKRRFGIDFLYPVDRYVTGLSAAMVEDRDGNLVPNPVFSDLDPADDISAVRDPGLVFFASIVGVPWQEIARKDAGGNPDLLLGLDANGDAVGGFQSSSELIQNGTWERIIGDPGNYVPPTDPHMVSSIDPRAGLAAPNSGYMTDPYNGHEFTVGDKRDDLQYACIFQLPAQRECAGATTSCDCVDAPVDNPLCQSAAGTYGTIQYQAKAYPGTRNLQVVRLLGDQGIVGSICAKQLDNAAANDYGYRPAIQSIVERLKQALGGQCLPRSLTPDANGQVPCLILEASRVDGQCICDPAMGREPVGADHTQAVEAAKQDPLYQTAQWNCFCEIVQPTGEALAVCQNDATSDSPQLPNGDVVNGWCYVDATVAPAVGNPLIVADCAATERRIIRFVGQGKGLPGATLFITCSGE